MDEIKIQDLKNQPGVIRSDSAEEYYDVGIPLFIGFPDMWVELKKSYLGIDGPWVILEFDDPDNPDLIDEIEFDFVDSRVRVNFASTEYDFDDVFIKIGDSVEKNKIQRITDAGIA